MANEANNSIGVFIDGGYYAKINEGFGNGRKVNLRELLSFICRKIAKDNVIDRKHLYITECHYYRGRYRAADAKAKGSQDPCDSSHLGPGQHCINFTIPERGSLQPH